MPSYDDLLAGRLSVSNIRRVELEDLLGRDPVVLDNAGLHEFLEGSVVLVTGAGGSIGSELCRQIGSLNPACLVLLENAENTWTRFWKIIFPLLSPFTLFLVITNLTYSFFDIFGSIDVLAGPGPRNSTTVLIYNLYQDLQTNHNTGSAAAQSVMLFALVARRTVVQLRSGDQRVKYNA